MTRLRPVLTVSACFAVCVAIFPNQLLAQWLACGTGGPLQCAPTGNVAIGTTSPSYLLHLNHDPGGANLLGSGLMWGRANSGLYGGAIWNSYSTDGLDTFNLGIGNNFAPTSNPILTIKAAGGSTTGGNVGLGTINPAYPLDISSATLVGLRINGTVGNTASNNTQLRFAGGKNGELWALGTDEAANNGSKDFHFYALPNAGNVVAMTLQGTTGNVGIGTTNPCANAPGFTSTCKLSVAGGIQAYEVLVNNSWSDYVFDPSYHLAPLTEVAGTSKNTSIYPVFLPPPKFRKRASAWARCKPSCWPKSKSSHST